MVAGPRAVEPDPLDPLLAHVATDPRLLLTPAFVVGLDDQRRDLDRLSVLIQAHHDQVPRQSPSTQSSVSEVGVPAARWADGVTVLAGGNVEGSDIDGSHEASDELVCFIIGPIGDKLSDPGTEARQRYEQAILTVENVIEPACNEVGITDPIRADKYVIAGEIPEQIFRLLRDADIVIADLTDANPNVMYELGLRHSRNVLTLQVGEQQRLPFDVQTIRTVKFKRTEGGYIDAKNTLREMLERGLTGDFQPVTATRVWNEGLQDGTSGLGGPEGPPPVRPQDGMAAGGREAASRLAQAAQAQETGDEGEDDEPGYIELLVEMEDAMPRVTEALEDVAAVTGEFGDIARRGTEELQESEAKGSGAKGRLLVAIRFAERLDEPIEKMGNAASRLRADAAIMDQGLQHLFAVVRDGEYAVSEVEEITSGLESFVTTRDAYLEARPEIEGFRNSAATLRKMARPVKARIDRLTKLIDQVLDASSNFERWGNEAEELIRLVQEREASSTGGEGSEP